MIIIDQLRVAADGTGIILDAHVNEADTFKNVYIKSVSIDTQDTISQVFDQPSSKPVYTKSIGTVSDKKKEIHLFIEQASFPSNLTMSKTLFYVFIEAGGTPSSDCPCGLDKQYTLGVTFDTRLLYNQMMGFTKEMLQDCSVPGGFINLILLSEALKVSIETGNYLAANKFFAKLIKNTVYPAGPKRCGCHG